MRTATPPPFVLRFFQVLGIVVLGALIASVSVLSASSAQAADAIDTQNGIRFSADDTDVPGGATVTYYDASFGTDVDIPDTVTIAGNTYDVVKIDDGVFSGSELTSITIPSSVKTIGNFAFAGNQLTSITIPGSVETIDNSAFAGNQLTSITIPSSVKTIGNSAFAGNQLTSITIPDSVTAINDWAFSGNQLTSVTISKSLTTISDGVFYGNQLTSVTIPDEVTTIGRAAFHGNHLTSLALPAGVITIGDSAFASNWLASVAIPDSVTEIGNGAFYDNDLKSVTIPDSVTTIGSGAFNYNPDLAQVWFTGMAPELSRFGDSWLGDDSKVTVFYPKAHEAVNGGPGYTTPEWHGYKAIPYFAVSFDANGGEGTMPPQQTAHTAATITSNSFTRYGYAFTGWNTAANGSGTSFTDGATYGQALQSDLTLYALWSVEDYTITYDLAGGDAHADTNPATYTIESEQFTLTNPTRTGYTFAGWEGTDLTDATPSVTIHTGSTGDRSYTATWSLNPVDDSSGQMPSTPAHEASGGLPATGGSSGAALLVGAAALLVGAAITIIGMRRRNS